MKKLLFTRNKRTILKAMLVFVSLIFLNGIITAQTLPKLPVLSLGVASGGSQGSASTDWYPDNRIWVVPDTNTSNTAAYREIIIPVFISNRWFTHPNYQNSFTTSPISSFSFRLYYNGNALEFVDLQKEHPFTREEAEALNIRKFNIGGVYSKPLSEHFNLSADVENVKDYYQYFDYKKPQAGGKAITITGETFSNYSLKVTGENDKEILLYVKFRVLATAGTTSANKLSSYLYFDPTYILYNGINIAKDSPLNLFSKYDTKALQTVIPNELKVTNNNFRYWNEAYSDGKPEIAVQSLVGLSEETNINLEQKYVNESYLPGSILLRVLSDLPEFNFAVQNPASNLKIENQIHKAKKSDDTTKVDNFTWVLEDPITTDNPFAASSTVVQDSLLGIRYIDVSLNNNTDGSLMNDIIIETDQEWLKWKTTDKGIDGKTLDNYKNPVTSPVRRGYIDYINKIVGTPTQGNNPFGTTNYNRDKNIRLAIVCDPRIDGSASEKIAPGIYTGYVTLKSAYNKFNPTKIKVTFVYFANPVEFDTLITKAPITKTTTHGIHLKLTPQDGTNNGVNLIMGSAERATNYADTLYGEFPHPYPFGKNKQGDVAFDARFFLDSIVYPAPNNDKTSDAWKQWDLLVRNGFGDFAQSSSNPRSNSRDIRDLKDTLVKSHIYKVSYKWNNAGQDNYHVKLEWNRNEFPSNTTIYLKTIFNGVAEYADMKSTDSYTFGNGHSNEFYIEYTIGSDDFENLVDNFGGQLVKPNGWNLLSLPLKPADPYYTNVFKNAINIPYKFVTNIWQPVADGKLQPGYGYFIKYGAEVDKKFMGSAFNEISKTVNPVVVNAGWNAIGGLSVRYPVWDQNGQFNIKFDQYSAASGEADVNYTENCKVWAYITNRGYEIVPALYPGNGYFIKVDVRSYLHLDGKNLAKQAISIIPDALANHTSGFDKINIADNAQNMSSLYIAEKYVDASMYELPPTPAIDMFDVRYSNNRYLTNTNESIINLQGITYPISINIESAKSSYSISDIRTDYVYGTVKAGEAGTIIIPNSSVDAFKLTATTVENTCFVTINANPVITADVDLSFGIEEANQVEISLYNSLGSEVTVLVNGNYSAGVHNEIVNFNNIPSGNYIVKMVTGGKSTIHRINVIK